jgi:hypothetical protein
MAKKQPQSAPAKPVAKPGFVPDPCAIPKLKITLAAGIAGQILVHFGAGFGAQRQIMSPGKNAQIFDSPSTPSAFTSLLISSIIKNEATLKWDTNVANRDAVCRTAFAHGKLACQRTAGGPLDWGSLYSTLQEIKAAMCPGGAGGGAACDF